ILTTSKQKGLILYHFSARKKSDSGLPRTAFSFRKSGAGFSVVEMVIYIGLVSLCLLLIIDLVVVMSSSYRKLTLARIVADSASFSMERITREIRVASDIDMAQSVFNTSPGRIRLQSADAGGYAQSVPFALEDGRINVYENDLLSGALTSNKASTTALVFTRFATATSTGLMVLMDVQASKGEDVRSAEFRTFVQMRNSY